MGDLVAATWVVAIVAHIRSNEVISSDCVVLDCAAECAQRSYMLNAIRRVKISAIRHVREIYEWQGLRLIESATFRSQWADISRNRFRVGAPGNACILQKRAQMGMRSEVMLARRPVVINS